MIWLTPDYGESPVKLLCKNRSYHLVGECHIGEGHHRVSPGIHLLRESVGPSNHENHIRSPVEPLPDEVGKFHGAVFPTSLIEENDKVPGSQGRKDKIPFLLLDLLLCESRYIFQFGNLLQSESDIMGEAGNIEFQTLPHPADIRLADGQQSYFHIVQIYTCGSIFATKSASCKW